MSRPIVIAHHLIWTAYGCWLPNDPRGSGSHIVRNDVLARLGDLHFGRKAVQPAGKEIREFYANAAAMLLHPLLTFDVAARASIAEGFARAFEAERYTCYGCAILLDHVHVLIRKHKHDAETMMEVQKEASRYSLVASNFRAVDHPTWTQGGYFDFLGHPSHVQRTISYIDRNPSSPQTWPFVQPYDGWPLHPGHNPNSPYARRLRESGYRLP